MFGPDATLGMLRENDRIDRRRLELAQAFTQFRQANPHASLDELQMFVDQAYGPGNLLYGTPSRDVLQTVSRDNQRRKMEHDSMTQLERMTRQAQLQGTLMAQAERIAGMTDDPAVAYAQFNQMFGNNPMARDLVRPEMFAGLQNRANAEFVRQNLDVAIRAIENGQDLAGMFPGMSRTRLDLLKTNAEQEAKRRREDREREIETREIDRATKLSAAGVDYTLPSTIAPDTPLGRSLTTTASRISDARRRELINREADELRTKSPELQTRILAGDRDSARMIIVQRLRALSPNREPSNDEIEVVMSSIIASAQGLQTQNRQRTLQEVDKQASEAATALIRERQATADATLGDKKLVAQRFGSGPIGDILARTIRERKLPLSGETLNAIGEVVKSSDFQRQLQASGLPPTGDAIMAALQAHPVIGPRLREETNGEALLSRERQMRRNQLGLFDQQKAEDFVAAYTQSVPRLQQTLQRQLETNITSILSDQKLSPELRRQRLMAQRELLANTQREAEAELVSRLRYAQNWQDVGGRPFTSADAEQLAGQLRAAIHPLMARVDAAIQALPQRAPDARTMAPTAAAPASPPAAPRTPIMDAIRGSFAPRPTQAAPSLDDARRAVGDARRLLNDAEGNARATNPMGRELTDDDLQRLMRTPADPTF